MAHLLDELHVPIDQREYGFDQNLYDEWKSSGLFGGTALHAAAKENKLENAEFLVGRGIGRDIKDERGHRAVDLARELGHGEVVALLEGAVPGSPS